MQARKPLQLLRSRLDWCVTLNQNYRSPFPYPIAQARSGLEVMKRDGLVENPASMRGAPYGAFDPDRVTRMLDILRPIYGGQRKTVPPTRPRTR